MTANEEESNSGVLSQQAGLMGAGTVKTANRTSEAMA